jgi:hypothetical protein
VTVTWNAASDNVGVAQYRVLRDGAQVGLSTSLRFDDTGLSPATSYTYTVVASDAAGNVSGASSPAAATTAAATGRILNVTPANYLSQVSSLRAGDTMRLAAGTYNNAGDPPGLPIFNMNGTASQPITIEGPSSGARAIFIGRNTHNTVRISNSSHVILRNFDIQNGNDGAFGVAAQGTASFITIEGLTITGVGGNQQNVGISTSGGSTWNWVVRGNTIIGAGTGMYFGSSTGGQPFVAGIIENNLVLDSIGYNVQVKHQVPRPTNVGLPTNVNKTIIRNNVFSKQNGASSGGDARPNLLVGHFPITGIGSEDLYEIYGNFFHENPSEALFQGNGNVSMYGNVLVNRGGAAINVQPQNDGSPRTVLIFGNTVLARDGGIRVSGASSGYTQRIVGNAVFAATPVTGPGLASNITDSLANAANYLNAPNAALGSFDPYPKSGTTLRGTAIDAAVMGALTERDLDFNRGARDWAVRGAYGGTGANPGWLPKRERKP